MGIRPVLMDVWRFVFESREGLRDVFKHGDVDSASYVVPVDVQVEVLLAVLIV
jgi:hypothetical protein